MEVFILVVSLVFTLNGDKGKLFSVDDLTGKSTPLFYKKRYELQDEVKASFILMEKEALKSGVQLEIFSDYRSYEHQKRIWTRKYNRFLKDGMTPQDAISKIIEYSTIPGTSRHHWGTDVDVIDGNMERPKGDVLNEIHFEGKGVYSKLKKWMDERASEFGFCLVYTDDESRKGFKYEPWHYTYEPISREMLKAYLKIDIRTFLKKDRLTGSEYFTDAFMNQYVKNNILDINPDVKN
jgi:LAS superfamily LD-carboxypeptidase LdcB|tara:strand:- start:163 stop:873 length:711 start_codon:yes stop_codon:yes gene_type:complete